LLLVWFGISLPTAAAVIAPVALPETAIAALAPVCASKRLSGRECVFCGMTRAFVAIARGDFKSAAASNRAALPLFASFAANALAAGCVAFRRDIRAIIARGIRMR